MGDNLTLKVLWAAFLLELLILFCCFFPECFEPKVALEPSIDGLWLLFTRSGFEVHVHPCVGNPCLP